MLHAPPLNRKRPVTAVGSGPVAGGAPGVRGSELAEGASSDRMTIMPLGGGQEVGRSCIVVQYRGATVMLDCGLHTQRKGLDALPFLDIGVELGAVDLLLVTHFHMDHVACLPYLTEHTEFSGRIFMTHPTKAVMRMLLQDYVRKHQDDVLYNEEDLNNCLAKCEVIDTHSAQEHRGIRFKAYAAGHVLGACMFLIEMGGATVLYTGDYSMEEDRHLMAAEVPSVSPDVLIVESTFGLMEHPKREDKEHRLLSAVEEVVVKNHGCCLLPVFALGRAQELLLLLDEHWQKSSHLQEVPVYYASGISAKAIRVYQTYVNMMNDHIRSRQLEEPFKFRHIQPWPSSNLQRQRELLGGRKPCVVMATPGTLEGGLAGKLMGSWCDQRKHGVVLTGFLPEGTPARELTRVGSNKTFATAEGERKDVQCSVHEMSFAAHVDFPQNYDFISRVRPAHIVLVHGEKRTMELLKAKLVSQTMTWPQGERPAIFAPPNVSIEVRNGMEVVANAVHLKFARPKRAKALGKFAEQGLGVLATKGADQRVDAVLVSQDFSLSLVASDELPLYAPVHPMSLQQRLSVPFAAKPQALVDVLQRLFADVTVAQPAAEAEAAATEDKASDAEKAAAEVEQAAASATASSESQATASAAATLPELIVTVVGPHATGGASGGDGGSAGGAADTQTRSSTASGRGHDVARTLDTSGSVRCVFHAAAAPGAVVLEWDLASPAADLLADSIVAAAMHAQASPHALVMSAAGRAPDTSPIAKKKAPPTSLSSSNTKGKARNRSRGNSMSGASGEKGNKVAAAASGDDDEEKDEALSEEEEEEEDEALPDTEAASNKEGGDKGSAMDADEGEHVGAYQEAASMLERDLLSKLADLLALRFDVVGLIKEPAANTAASTASEGSSSSMEEVEKKKKNKGSSLGAWALQISNEPARMPPPPPSTISALAALQSAADKAATSSSAAPGAGAATAAAAAATAVAALTAAGSPTCFVRWVAGAGLQVEAAPAPSQLEVLASAHLAAAAITPPTGVSSTRSSSLASSSSSGGNEAGALAADPPGVVALNGWTAKGQALTAAVEHALAHALAAAGPVRTDAAW